MTACQRAESRFTGAISNDLPFQLVPGRRKWHRLKAESPHGVHARRAGAQPHLPESWFPATLDLAEGEKPLAARRAARRGAGTETSYGWGSAGSRISAGLWPDPVQQAVVLPMRSAGQERLRWISDCRSEPAARLR